ncbi:MAG: hypothetical protein IMZ55_08335, partial [Acidobacteria bacterium]|nr:hypothetical protein [Acidobacteriota bacterium]
MKRNTVLVILVVLAVALFLFNPLKLLQNRDAAVRRPSTDPALLDPLLRYAEASYQTPEDYVIHSLADHDIVFLGEFYKIKQNVRLVSALVPRLAAAGVRNLGFEYALSDSQRDIDALLASPSWDETRARGILI